MPSKRNIHKKSSKTATTKMTNDVPTLLLKAQENIDKMDYQVALLYLKKALTCEPNNLEVVDLTAMILMEIGEDSDAFPLLVQSVKADPEHNFEKWMYLGQLQNGNDSMTCYRKGIELLEKDLASMEDGDEKQLLLIRLCGAYCSIGELYMTDLCEEDNAEQNCEACIQRGLSIYPNSVEGLVILASCRMSQCRFDEAECVLMQVNDIIASIDTTHDLLPAYDVRLFAGKMLLELDNDDSCRDRCEAAINLFDQLLLENDDNNELLFLTATAHFNLQCYTLGIEFATELEKRITKALKETPDVPELAAQMEEVKKLLVDLHDGLAKNPEADKLEETEGDANGMQEE